MKVEIVMQMSNNNFWAYHGHFGKKEYFALVETASFLSQLESQKVLNYVCIESFHCLWSKNHLCIFGLWDYSSPLSSFYSVFALKILNICRGQISSWESCIHIIYAKSLKNDGNDDRYVARESHVSKKKHRLFSTQARFCRQHSLQVCICKIGALSNALWVIKFISGSKNRIILDLLPMRKM